MYNLIKQCNSGWKMIPLATKLFSNKLCFYHDIFFATEMRVSWKNGKIADALRTLCPNLPVYADLLSDRWRWYELISSLCSDLPPPTTECLQATPLVSLNLSWDGPVYSTATFPATFLFRFKLDLKEGATRCKRLQICFPTSLMLQQMLAS